MILSESEFKELTRLLVWAKNQETPEINKLIGFVNLLNHKALHYKVRSEKLESFLKNKK